MRLFITFLLIALTAGAVEGETLWVNNITVNEYGMTWNYGETLSGMDSIAFRIKIDTGFGDNDSFVNAWEVLIADKEIRREFRNQIEKEFDVRINNQTSGIEVVDIDATLSPELIGNTHSFNNVVNKYITVYKWRDSILNSGSIWFLGQANSPVTIIMPQGMDVINISGMDNETMSYTNHAEISGAFKAMTEDRGEITLHITRNTSYVIPEVNVSNDTMQVEANNSAKPVFEMLESIRNVSIILIGIILILVVYFFKIRRR